MESDHAPSIPKETPTGTNRRVGTIVALVIVLGLAGVISWWIGLGSYFAQRQEYAGKTETFSGSSESLQQTVVVPTLDTPCPPGKNVIWCSSFQLAWNEVRDKVIRAPLEVVGAEEVAARLNAAKQSGSDLEPSSFYASGGWVEAGIREKIQKDMAVKFPGHVLPDFSRFDSGILAYSYLAACVPFKCPFRQVDDGLVFHGSQGGGTAVEAFGLSEIDESRYQKIREQVAVLYCRWSDAPNSRHEMVEYVLDLCRYSQPYEVVVAMVEPKGSLAQILEHVRLQISESMRRANSQGAQAFGRNDVLEVPEMVWRIDHRFSELIGRDVANVGMPIVEALQTTAFRLDCSGAMLRSEATLAVKSSPKYFLFDRPFLVYMQKRGAEQPFFVMWVDNAELLSRK
jgi:hypothetical protein